MGKENAGNDTIFDRNAEQTMRVKFQEGNGEKFARESLPYANAVGMVQKSAISKRSPFQPQKWRRNGKALRA